MIFAESLDGSKFDECSITVNGSAEIKAADRESDFVFSALSAEDLQKINSLIFRNFYQFALTNEFDSESFTSASERRFSLIANVVPGTEIQESVRAQQAGFTDVRVLENINNAITFQGTFSQILIFVTDKADLREITGGGLHFIDKPIQLENEGNSEQKAINLQSNVEGNYSEPAETHMGTGTLVRATPHKMPVPTCFVLNSYCRRCYTSKHCAKSVNKRYVNNIFFKQEQTLNFSTTVLNFGKIEDYQPSFPPTPETPNPETPTPKTPTPKTPTPKTPTPKTPKPETPTPETPTPETVTPAPVRPVNNMIRFFSIGEILPATGISSTKISPKPDNIQYKDLALTLQIPSIDLRTNIVNVPLSDNEYSVTWLGESAGLLDGYPLPGKGRTIIAGHNHIDGEEIGPFALLKYVNEGDSITFIKKDDSMDIYTVYANEKIADTDFDTLNQIAESAENAVIFITCEDERVEGGYANRRIVAAMPK